MNTTTTHPVGPIDALRLGLRLRDATYQTIDLVEDGDLQQAAQSSLALVSLATALRDALFTIARGLPPHQARPIAPS